MNARLLVGYTVAIGTLLIGCHNGDRVAELRIARPRQSPTESELALARDAVLIKKRLSEVAALLGFDERGAADGQTIADFSQPVDRGAVELTARVEAGAIVVDVAQLAPKDSDSLLFRRARSLVEERLQHDFDDRVSEAKHGDSFWSFIRSEDSRQASP